jgi:hypothetical protein
MELRTFAEVGAPLAEVNKTESQSLPSDRKIKNPKNSDGTGLRNGRAGVDFGTGRASQHLKCEFYSRKAPAAVRVALGVMLLRAGHGACHAKIEIYPWRRKKKY